MVTLKRKRQKRAIMKGYWNIENAWEKESFPNGNFTEEPTILVDSSDKAIQDVKIKNYCHMIKYIGECDGLANPLK